MKKKSVFKVVSFILVAAIILGTFAGCGSIKKQNEDLAPTDTSGFTYYESSDENIVTDDGVTYVNNEVLVYLNSEADKPKLEKFLSNVGGKIVGELPKVAEYQVLLDKGLKAEEMNKLIEELNSQEFVSTSQFNYAFKVQPANTPNDSKWGKWGDIPKGKTWAMDAINARQAWDHVDEMQDVNVGIIDSGFDLNHEDLHFEETPLGMHAYLNQIEKDKSKDDDDPDKLIWDDHGTHVAGTIGASFNNKKGVAGVAPTAKLYGVSMYGLQTYEGFETSQCINVAIYYLIAEKNCKVVNISMSMNHEAFCANRHIQGKVDNPYALQVCKNYNESQEKILQVLIDRKYPFVICKSSGNENDEQGCCYYKKDSYDPQSEFAYYNHLDYKRYKFACEQAKKNKTHIADNEVNKYFDRHKDDLESVTDRDGHVDAGYSCIFDGIEDEDLKNRIIVVGAVGNNYHVEKSGIFGIFKNVIHDGFSLTGYSNCGSRVDILAPGGENSKKDANNKEIYSTVANNKYDTMAGTSMASPHVAGAAAVLFSLDPDMDSAKIKKLLCDTATGEYADPNNSNNKYKLLNLGNAVEELLKEMHPETTTQPQTEPQTQAQTEPQTESQKISIKDEIIKRRHKNISAYSTNDSHEHIIAIKKDGTVKCTDDFSKAKYSGDKTGNINTWKDIVDVSIFAGTAVGLKSDGTVLALGNNSNGKCNVSSWKNIVAVSQGTDFAVGLKSDGTVVCTDSKYKVEELKDIVAISSDISCIVAVKKDGSVVINHPVGIFGEYKWESNIDNAPYNEGDNAIVANELKNIATASFGTRAESCFIALKNDGTILSNKKFSEKEYNDIVDFAAEWGEEEPIPKSDYIFGDVKNWKNVVQLEYPHFSFETGGIFGLDCFAVTLNGNVLAIGSKTGAEKWSNIDSIAADLNNVYGITKNGHGISTNTNSEVNTWTDLAVY